MNKKLMALSASSLLLLATGGCWFKGFGDDKSASCSSCCSHDSSHQGAAHDENDPVVIRVNGKPEMRRSEVVEFGNQAIQANPYLAQFGITSFSAAPAQIREQVIDLLVQQKLISKWGTETGIDRTAEFKKEYDKLVVHLRSGLIAQNFDKRILDTVTVSEREIRDEYDRVKDQLVVDLGEVTVVGASFADEEKANVFYNLVKEGKEGSFKELAKESNADVTSFGSVKLDPRAAGNDDKVSPVMRQALSQLRDDEYVAQAHDGKTFWVLQVTGRSKRTYAPIEQVWDQLERSAKSNKFREARAVRVDELRGLYTVDVDSEALGAEEDPMAFIQQLIAAQQAQAQLADDADESDDEQESDLVTSI